MWIAISAVGCFATEDGGATWEARNKGVRTDFLPGPAPETGQCVHKMALATGDPERLYQQNHCGTYRSDDAGRTWINLDEGLPSTFGFPLVTSPVDGDTFFTVPLNGDDRGRFVPDARMAVWRTTDRGATWHDLRNGLPQHDAYLGVLRDAMARDTLDPFGLYVGHQRGPALHQRRRGRVVAPGGRLPAAASRRSKPSSSTPEPAVVMTEVVAAALAGGRSSRACPTA